MGDAKEGRKEQACAGSEACKKWGWGVGWDGGGGWRKTTPSREGDLTATVKVSREGSEETIGVAGWRYGWGIELILLYGLALLFFTVLPSLPLDRALSFKSLSFSLTRSLARFFGTIPFARVIYLSALARSFPQPRVKDLTSLHFDRTFFFEPFTRTISFLSFRSLLAIFSSLGNPMVRCICFLSHFVRSSLDGER